VLPAKEPLTKKLYNMKRFSEQLHKQSQTVKLKKSEQADLRARVVSYMEYHPLPASMKVAKVQGSSIKNAARTQILTDTFGQFMIPYQLLFKIGGVAAAFVLVFVPFMAERTVPGDTLYAVKVQFNEEVRSTLTWGSYEKVEWETTRLNRRIAEARLLADEGLLTTEVEASVAAAVKVHSDNAKREIEVLRASDADGATIATIAFDSSLRVQAQSLNRNDVDGTAAQPGDLIGNAIDASLVKDPETQTPDVPAYNKLMARVEMNTTRVRELLNSLDGSVSNQGLVDVTRRIEDIDRTISTAITQAGTSDTELAAREALVDVLVRTQKLIVFMTDLAVREQVAIESVVPVVLTIDEMTVERSQRQTELTNAISQLTTAVATVTDQDILAKANAALQQLEADLLQLQTMTAYRDFIRQSDQSLALAADALTLVGVDDGPVVPAVAVPVAAATTTVSTSTPASAVGTTTPTTTATTTQSQIDRR